MGQYFSKKEITIFGKTIKDPLLLEIAALVFVAATVVCLPLLFISATRVAFLVVMLLSYVASGVLVGVWFYNHRGTGGGGGGQTPSRASNVSATFGLPHQE
jgi:hypothetical protein